MQNCNFTGNGEFDFYASACSDPTTVLMAESNFWTATDSIIIADWHVYDNDDDSESPIVDFVPFLMEQAVGTVAGVVLDEFSNPVFGARVIVVGREIEDTTDADGGFLLGGLDADFYDVSFSHEQYRNMAICDLYVPVGDTTVLNPIMFSACYYVIGDANADSVYSGGDVIFGINKLFSGGPDPEYTCDCSGDGTFLYPSGDANGDCVYSGGDIIWGINRFFRTGLPAIPCPGCPPGGRKSSSAEAGSLIR